MSERLTPIDFEAFAGILRRHPLAGVERSGSSPGRHIILRTEDGPGIHLAVESTDPDARLVYTKIEEG